MTTARSNPLPGPIAYITGEYPRATDTFIQREVQGLRKHGVEVKTYSIRRTKVEHLVGPEQLEEAAQTYYVLSAARSPITLLRCHATAIWNNPARYFAAIRLAVQTSPPGLRALLYQVFYFLEAVVLANDLQRKGVVHLHNHIATASCTVAMLASKVSGIPYSFTIHGPDIFFEPIRWRIDEKIAQASFVACISHFCRSQAMIFAQREHWHKLHIVHCAVEPERYGSHLKQASTTSASDNPTCRLLFVGRLAAVKGVPILFKALADMKSSSPDLHLTLIGDGPERNALEKEVLTLGLSQKVTFAGYRSQAEVAESLRDADIFVLPSFAEGLPVVLMEALGSGVPVITTRIAGVPELVEDKVSGLLVPAGDPNALCKAIQELATDATKRRSFGIAGRVKVEQQFNIVHETQWLARLMECYLLNNKRLPVRPQTTAELTEFTSNVEATGT